jgi:hypothetical protein
MKMDSTTRSVRRVLQTAAWMSMMLTACGAPQSEPPSIDMDHELGVLYGCSISTLEEAGYSIDWREDGARMAATEWRELRDGERHRASIAVALHPSYGPGATARLHVEGRAAVDSAEASSSGSGESAAMGGRGTSSFEWVRRERDEAHSDWESGYLQQVQQCWRDRR